MIVKYINNKTIIQSHPYNTAVDLANLRVQSLHGIQL